MLKNIRTGTNLPISSYGKQSSTGSGEYDILFDYTKLMEHVNGIYELSLHVADINSANTFVWNMGQIKLWFKEGLDDVDNTGISLEFKPKEEIHNIFDEEAPSKVILVSF